MTMTITWTRQGQNWTIRIVLSLLLFAWMLVLNDWMLYEQTTYCGIGSNPNVSHTVPHICLVKGSSVRSV
jgi:hypothetical protein